MELIYIFIPGKAKGRLPWRTSSFGWHLRWQGGRTHSRGSRASTQAWPRSHSFCTLGSAMASGTAGTMNGSDLISWWSLAAHLASPAPASHNQLFHSSSPFELSLYNSNILCCPFIDILERRKKEGRKQEWGVHYCFESEPFWILCWIFPDYVWGS